MSTISELQDFAKHVRDRFKLPSVALAVLRRGAIQTAHSGVLNLETMEPVHPNSLFQIASITKLYTATRIVQLKESGNLDLDQAVKEIDPSLSFKRDDAEVPVTVRQLLAHTSGLDGDYLMHDDSGVASYVDKCTKVPLLFSPGRYWSYSNSGYVVLGHLIERLTGQTWGRSVSENILAPLKLEHSVVDPYSLASHSTAAGHIFSSDINGYELSRTGCFGTSMIPAGAFMLQSSSNLLAYAHEIMKALQGRETSILTAESIREMIAPQIELPRYNALNSPKWGLGFACLDHGAIGHAGGLIGYSSFLSIHPNHASAYSILLNSAGPNTRDVLRECRAWLHHSITKKALPSPGIPRATLDEAMASQVTGNYATESRTVRVYLDDSGLVLETENQAAVPPVNKFHIKLIDDFAFACFTKDTDDRVANVNFFGETQMGKKTHILVAGRAFKRIA